MKEKQRLIPFRNLFNVRDLGGYSTHEGKVTLRHKYIRATGKGTLSESEKNMLYNDFGVRAVVDLRMNHEVEKSPSPAGDFKNIAYYHVDLLDAYASILQNRKAGDDSTELLNKDMGDFYVMWIEDTKKQIEQTFRIFLKHLNDCVLFHCTQGKDRTGIIAALLLGIAGCSEEDIVADYSESFANNLMDTEYLNVSDELKPFMKSEPRYIQKMLAHIDFRYGGISKYMQSIGLSETELELLRNNFT